MATLLNSVANLFRPTQQVTIAPSAPLQQQNPGADATIVPPAGTSKETPPNPLDDMAALWQTDPKSTPPVDPLSTPLFNTDPAKIAAAASKIDFASQVPPEMMAKAMSGTDPNAFMQVMNFMVQRGLATATQLNAATIEHATSRNNARIETALPDRFKRMQLDAMQADHPILQHSASQPFLQLLRSQIQMKEPGLSAAQINAKAESALIGFAGQVSAPTPAQQVAEQQKTAGTDWDTWAAS